MWKVLTFEVQFGFTLRPASLVSQKKYYWKKVRENVIWVNKERQYLNVFNKTEIQMRAENQISKLNPTSERYLRERL